MSVFLLLLLENQTNRDSTIAVGQFFNQQPRKLNILWAHFQKYMVLLMFGHCPYDDIQSMSKMSTSLLINSVPAV